MTGLQTLHSDPPQPNREGAASAVPVRKVFPNLITSAELARKAVTAGADFAVVGTKSEAARELFKDKKAFKIIQFVRSDRGFWSHAENLASLPMVCLSNEDWLERISRITVWPAPAVDRPWELDGKVMANQVLVCIEVSDKPGAKSFSVGTGSYTAVEDEDDVEDLGFLSSSRPGRQEFVLETTKADADRIYGLKGVSRIAQRRVGIPPGPTHVRLTVACEEESLASVVANTDIWAPSTIRVPAGLSLYQTEEQWSELSRLIGEPAQGSLFAGVTIAESPRWIIIALKSPEHRQAVLSKLTEWRTGDAATPKLSSDIFYRAWHRSGDSFVVEAGTIDGLTDAVIERADPRFKEDACEAFLDKLQIPAETRKIAVTENRDDDAIISYKVTVKVPRQHLDRLTAVARRFTWQGETMKVRFSKAMKANAPTNSQKSEGDQAPGATTVMPQPARVEQQPILDNREMTPSRKASAPATPSVKSRSGGARDRKKRKRGVRTPNNHQGAREDTGHESDDAMNSDDGLCGDDEKWSDEEAHDAEMSEVELGDDTQMEEEGTNSSSTPSPLKKGDYVMAPRFTPDGDGPEELLRLEEFDEQTESTWKAQRVQATSATANHEPRHVGTENEQWGWLVSHPERQPRTNWFSEKKYGVPGAKKEAQKIQTQWTEEAKWTSLRSSHTTEHLCHSLLKARKCGALETAARKAADNTKKNEGGAEVKKRIAAAKRRNDNPAGGGTAGPPARVVQ